MATPIEEFMSQWQSNERFREEFRLNPVVVVDRLKLTGKDRELILSTAKLSDKELEERISKRR